jgi:hypothetical protein
MVGMKCVSTPQCRCDRSLEQTFRRTQNTERALIPADENIAQRGGSNDVPFNIKNVLNVSLTERLGRWIGEERAEKLRIVYSQSESCGTILSWQFAPVPELDFEIPRPVRLEEL